MKKRALALLMAYLALAACAFSSEAPLFAESESAAPIADGAVFDWRENPEGESVVVSFHRVGAGYELRPVSKPDEEPMRGILFIPVTQTPVEDFIVQIQFKPDETAATYAFLWRVGDRYRMIVAPPDELEANASSPFCKQRQMGECGFVAAADVRAYYERVLYPVFVTGAATPENFLELTPTPAPHGGSETR